MDLSLFGIVETLATTIGWPASTFKGDHKDFSCWYSGKGDHAQVSVTESWGHLMITVWVRPSHGGGYRTYKSAWRESDIRHTIERVRKYLSETSKMMEVL